MSNTITRYLLSADKSQQSVEEGPPGLKSINHQIWPEFSSRSIGWNQFMGPPSVAKPGLRSLLKLAHCSEL